MRVAVMSDSHDNIWNLRKALDIIKRKDVSMIIHCGDFVAPFMLDALEKTGVPVHGVFGNNDGDQYLLTKYSYTKFSNITFHGLIGMVNADALKIGFTHQGEVGKGLAAAGMYPLVCYGHSHEYSVSRINETILLNPGEIMGKEGLPGFCIVDTGLGADGIKRIEIS